MSSHPPLPSVPQRQASSTIGAYLYQIWYSLFQWTRLTSDEALYLEGSEDIDQVGGTDANAIQVRQTQAKISLNTEYAREALANFWTTSESEARENRRSLRCTYLTTSEIAIEKNASFGGRSGIQTWEHARYEEASAEQLRDYLIANAQARGTFLHFLRVATTTQLQEQLFKRFQWVTGAPDLDKLKELVIERLAERLLPANLGRANLEAIQDRLLAHCLDTVRNKSLHERMLTSGKLDLKIQEATTFYMPLPVGSLGGLVSAPHMLSLHGVEMPLPPEPLLGRPQLTGVVAAHLRMRESVFLTGSIFKGKTTIAALVGREAFPDDAWWIDLKQRSSELLKDIFSFIARIIDRDDTPSLIILDDLDTGATAKEVYGRSLSNLVFRAKSSGKVILLTARGSADEIEKADAKSWDVLVVDVPAMDEREVRDECLNAGCLSDSQATHWADAIVTQTAGHPKLVQVRLEELVELGWPCFDSTAKLQASAAVHGARKMAQGLFLESVSGAEAEYVYAIAEFSVPPTREMLVNLSDLPPPLQGAASLLHKIEGRWLESTRGNRYRVTPMLRATVGETWSIDKHRSVHGNIFDSIAKCSELTGRDGAALTFHSFICRDSARIKVAYQAIVSMKEQRIKEHALSELSWIVPLAIQEKEEFYPLDKQSSLWLRHIQFQAGEFQGVPELTKIVNCWRDEVSTARGEVKAIAELILDFSIFMANAHLAPEVVLDSAVRIHNASSKNTRDVILLESLSSACSVLRLPETATRFQIYLCVKNGLVRGLKDFVGLLNWLEACCNSELLREFDEMHAWQTVVLNGLFVHTGWIADSKLTQPNWEQWESELQRAWSFARSRAMSKFGTEIARAISVILSEQAFNFSRSQDVLVDALADFGPSAVLIEQRSNAYFQAERYAEALDSWKSLVEQYGRYACLDPNSYRRTALAASNLSLHFEAAQLFEDGANIAPRGEAMPTRCALLAEAALAYHFAGRAVEASNLMGMCFQEIPRDEKLENDPRWEASLRMFGAIASTLAGHGAMMTDGKPVVINLGMASNPTLRISQTDENHGMRMTMLELAIITGKQKAQGEKFRPSPRLAELLESSVPLTRWLTSLELIGNLLETECSSWYPELVEKMFEAAEKIRETTSFAKIERSAADIMGAYYVLAAVCDGRSLDELISVWAVEKGTPLAPTTHSIFDQLSEGWRTTRTQAVQQIRDKDLGLLLRCGAALLLLSSPLRDARDTAYAQGILTHAMQISGVLSSFARINVDSLIAKKYALTWEELLSRPQLFVAPSLTIPALKSQLSLVQKSHGKLKGLLQVAGAAGGLDLSSLTGALD